MTTTILSPDTLIAALASAENQPATSFAALEAFARLQVGAKLFTIMKFDHLRNEASRIYSNQAEAYPVNGTKQVTENAWTAQVIDAGETFVANDIEAIAEVFDDHLLIQSLGCESVVNVPVIAHGVMLGSLNLLHEKNFYTIERVAAAESLALAACACLLLEASL